MLDHSKRVRGRWKTERESFRHWSGDELEQGKEHLVEDFLVWSGLVLSIIHLLAKALTQKHIISECYKGEERMEEDISESNKVEAFEAFEANSLSVCGHTSTNFTLYYNTDNNNTRTYEFNCITFN